MKTTKHPRELTDAEAEAIVDEFDSGSDYVVTATDALTELRAAAAARREADSASNKPRSRRTATGRHGA